MDKEQCGGWYRLALRRSVAGLVSQVQLGILEKVWFRMVRKNQVTFP